MLVTVVLAEPAILLLGGEQYRDAAPILQVQAFALLGIFLSQVWTLGLISLRRQRDVAVANGIVLVLVLVLGVVLVRAYEGIGGAAAAVVDRGRCSRCSSSAFLARAGSQTSCRGSASCRGRSSPALAGALVALLPLSPLARRAARRLPSSSRSRSPSAPIPPEIVPALRGRKPL